MNIFDINSPFVQFLGRMADMMWLNILTVVCCLPIITAGASLTAMNYMALKIVRNEDTYITRGFFRSFKENFRQSTVIWCLFLLVGAVLGGDFYIIRIMDVEISNVIKIVIFVIGLLVLFTFMFVFPAQAKFANPIKRTIVNAFAMSVAQFPKTILMIVLYLLPYVLLLLSRNMTPIVMLFGLSVPALLSAKLYNKFFLKLENQIMEQSGYKPGDDDEHIFSDELVIQSDIGQND